MPKYPSHCFAMGKFLDPTGTWEGRPLGRLKAQDIRNLRGIEPRTFELLLNGRAVDWNTIYPGFESRSGEVEFSVHDGLHVDALYATSSTVVE
ncbi:hypothetical protein OUZ56_031277 [Daphnia magna]|uniref:Uncharacterized protein n=1 Tax=Daphnia magna TaxID=35525 RepID=A0ABQ9ZU66_9CRUS|nr:hypothetical protein OUZ56_031277 [Daphnia magna]